MWLQPFARTNVLPTKNQCFAFWARVDTKLLNLSHHFVSMDGWPGGATFSSVGPTFEDHPHVFSQKRSSPLEFIFDTCASASSGHLFGWWSWTYVVVDFFKDQCMFSKKPVFCILGACWHKILEFVTSFPIYGWLAWWCDFFPVGPTFEDHPHVFSQKRSSPLEFIFDTCASASSSHLVWLVKLNICGCSLLLGQIYFQQKNSVLHFGRVLTQNSWICHIISYLWMVGLVMRLFSCWANLWRSSACIQPKKIQPLGIYFWYLRLGLFKSPCLVGEAEHMWLQPFARTNVCSAKNICFAFWARVQDKCTPLQGQMYLWNLFLMSNLRTFSIIIIIAPFSQI